MLGRRWARAGWKCNLHTVADGPACSSAYDRGTGGSSMSAWVGLAAVAGWLIGQWVPPGPSYWLVTGVVAVYLGEALRRSARSRGQRER